MEFQFEAPDSKKRYVRGFMLINEYHREIGFVDEFEYVKLNANDFGCRFCLWDTMQDKEVPIDRIVAGTVSGRDMTFGKRVTAIINILEYEENKYHEQIFTYRPILI